MAKLGPQVIKDSYEQVLHVDADGGGNGATRVGVKDGDNGTTFLLGLSTTGVYFGTSFVARESAGGTSYLEMIAADGETVYVYIDELTPGVYGWKFTQYAPN